jgi:predicted Ser/Thr protein kinase
MPADSETDPGSVGPYRLVQRLGEGGMGVVHLGLDDGGRAVAVKVMRAHVAADPDARRRLAREVETLRRVRHPRVAEVIDADVDGEVPYLVTRFVPGKPLDAHVREHGPLARGHVAHVGAVLADALRAIHDAGVVHRDVKPANVMLLDGEPVLIDFGIAHVADETRITMTGLVMGTPGYLSPEVVAGQPVTTATDWWGWGATLVFAATGRAPFGSGPIEVVLDRVRRGQCDLTGLGGPLRDALAAALTVDPALRPPPDDLVRGLTGPTPRRAPAARAAAGRDDVTVVTPAPGPGEAPTTRTPAPGEAATTRTPRPNEELTARVPPPWPQPPVTPGHGTSAPAAASAAGAPAPAAPPPPAGVAGVALPPTRRFDHPGSGGDAQRNGMAPRPGQPGPLSPNPPAHPGARQQPPYGAPSPTQVRDRPPPPPGVAGAPRPPQAQGQQPGGQPPAAPPRNRGFPAAKPETEPGEGRYGRGVLLGVVVALAAMATVAPYGTAWIVFYGTAFARVVDRSSTALLMRRRTHGPRGSDAAMTVMALPWRILVALVVSVFAMVLPLLVGISTAFIVGTAQAGVAGPPVPADPVPLGLGMAALVLAAWWGPGGGAVRRGSRMSVATVARGPRSQLAVWAVLALLLLAALLTLGNGADPDFGPLEGSRLLTQLG